MKKSYLVVKNPAGVDISQEIELADGKACLMWSQYKIMHRGQQIGWLESGCPMDPSPGYTFEVVDDRPSNWPPEDAPHPGTP